MTADSAPGMPSFPFACVLLGCSRTITGSLAASEERKPGVAAADLVARTAAEAGADPVVLVAPAEVQGPNGVRRVVAPSNAGFAASVRLGLAQLANSAAEAALLWPVEVTDVGLTTVLAVLDAGKRIHGVGVAPAYQGRPGYPCLLPRGSWQEAMALADGGPDAIFETSQGRIQSVAVEDAAILLASHPSSSG